MYDADVRAAVRGHLENLHRGDSATRIVEEMGVWSGTVRIDIAVINGELSGYELKSDRDNLARLPAQIEVYNRVFDKVTLVVGKRHMEHAKRLVPAWWGITKAVDQKGIVELKAIRQARMNRDQQPYLVAQLLWREEAVAALDEFGIVKGWRSKPVKAIHERLASEIPLPRLKETVRERLKARTNWLGQLMSDNGQMSVQ